MNIMKRKLTVDEGAGSATFGVDFRAIFVEARFIDHVHSGGASCAPPIPDTCEIRVRKSHRDGSLVHLEWNVSTRRVIEFIVEG